MDLDAWHASIAAHRSPVRRIRNRFRSGAPEPATLLLPGGDAEVLIVVDALSPSQVAALIAPMRHLDPSRVAVLTTPAAAPGIPEATPSRSSTISDAPALTRALPALRCVLAVGDYMQLGALAHASAERAGAAFLVVQHGIVTPFAPPLPSGAELLAWSEADAAFWTAGRSDVSSHVVGGQLLHEAHTACADRAPRATRTGDTGSTGAASPTSITYLGQLHGHELPRRAMARAAERFCRSTGAVYRPHPSESDIASRLQHRLWRLRGIEFDPGRTPLPDLGTSVVSVFSTGVLEAAAAGIPSWVDFPDPPVWLAEIWQRYGMQRHGSTVPTEVAPTLEEPARLIAGIIEQRATRRP